MICDPNIQKFAVSKINFMKHTFIIIFVLFVLPVFAVGQERDTTATMLKEVVVTGDQVKVEQQGRNLTITNIKGSDLSSAGTIFDMLAWTPGLMLDESEQVKVVGTDGVPLIYINGVRQSDDTKLKLLSAGMVKKVEVIRDPGSEYPAGTSSVVKITTSIPFQDLIGINLIDRMNQRMRFSNNTTANAFGTIGKVDFAASASYGFSNSRQSASSTEGIIANTGNIIRELATEQQDYIHSYRWTWFGGATYHPGKDDELQLEYSGNTSAANRTFAHTRYTRMDNQFSELSFDSRNHGEPENHTFLSSYIHEFEKSTLTLTANYNNKHLKSEEDVYIMPSAELTQVNNKESHSDLWTVQGDYTWSFYGKDSQSAGIYGGRSFNKSSIDYTSTGVQDVKSSVSWAEMYMNSRFDLFKCTFTLGLRARYEKQWSESNLNAELVKYRKEYFNVVPSLSIWHRFTKSFAMNLHYKYGYELPSFSQLRPTVTLDELIFYETGNPDLKIPRNHYLVMVLNIKKVQIAAEYRYHSNQIMDITEPIAETDYFLVHPINMSGCYSLALEASYNLNINQKFRLYAFGKLRRAHVEYIYADELVRRNNLFASVYVNGSYNILPNLSVFATAGYWSPQLVDNIRSGYSCNISFGSNLSLLKSKLNVRLSVEDVLRRSVTPSWTSYSPNLKQTRINRYDTRGVTLTLTYRFTVPRQKYSELDNADDYWRM